MQYSKKKIEGAGPQELLLGAVYKCLEASTDIPANYEPSDCLDQHFSDCHTIFVAYLCNNPAINSSVVVNKVSFALKAP